MHKRKMTLWIFLTASVLFFGLCDAGPNLRIYGGYFAREGQFPYQAAIYANDMFTCGAAIYNHRYILTAAHCVLDVVTEEMYELDELKIVVGVTNLTKLGSGTSYQVIKIMSHSNYDSETHQNDIALLKVDRPIKFTKFVQPIQLHDGNFKSGDVIISGWGANEQQLSLPFLKFHKLKAYAQPKCAKAFKDDYPGFICIEHTKDNGMCYGDSGGPAIFGGKLIGIASVVIWRCGTEVPDAYVYVPFYKDWINDQLSSSANL